MIQIRFGGAAAHALPTNIAARKSRPVMRREADFFIQLRKGKEAVGSENQSWCQRKLTSRLCAGLTIEVIPCKRRRSELFSDIQSGHELSHQTHAHLIDHPVISTLKLFTAFVGPGDAAQKSVGREVRLKASQGSGRGGFGGVVQPALLRTNG